MTEEIKEELKETQDEPAQEQVKPRGKTKPPGGKKDEPVIWATGRRKTSIARVKMVPGTGKIRINKKDLEGYFGGHIRYKSNVMATINLIPEASNFDYFINVHGGGIMGNSEAIRLGMARGISYFNESFRPKLKAAGLLSRDPRMVERKKPGQPKARKKFQWTKR